MAHVLSSNAGMWLVRVHNHCRWAASVTGTLPVRLEQQCRQVIGACREAIPVRCRYVLITCLPVCSAGTCWEAFPVRVEHLCLPIVYVGSIITRWYCRNILGMPTWLRDDGWVYICLILTLRVPEMDLHTTINYFFSIAWNFGGRFSAF